MERGGDLTPDFNPDVRSWLAGLGVDNLKVEVHGNAKLVVPEGPADKLSLNVCRHGVSKGSLNFLGMGHSQKGPSVVSMLRTQPSSRVAKTSASVESMVMLPSVISWSVLRTLSTVRRMS